jgi:hypothetical protein
MSNTSEEKSLTFAAKEPNVTVLQKAYDDTLADLEPYFQQCRQNYDDRNNIWPGKTRDLRKHGSDAFPWDGASDSEAHVIDERINSYVSLLMSSMVRANIRAYPVEFGDMARARVVSSFLKWMVSSYIPRFKKEMESSANHLLERGIAVTYVGWQREDRTYLQRLDLQQLAQVDPQLAQAVIDGSADDQIIAMLRSVYPSVTDARAKKALKDLRKKGIAEIPVSRRQVDCPLVQSLTPDGDFFFPSYTTDPQRAPYCFWRTYFTAQELKNKVSTEGWDADWVDYVIEHYRGVNIDTIGQENNTRKSVLWDDMVYEANELIEIVYGYQRLVDPIDNSEGIYCTVFHRELSSKISEIKPYGKFELMNGYEDYPVIVTRLSEASKRLYDVQSMADILRGIQWQVKIERDSRTDRNSMATMPPIMHPVGNAPSDWGPGRFVPYRRGGEFQFGPTPQYNPGSVEMERTLLDVADRLVGLSTNDPSSATKRQFILDKFLLHIQDVIKMAFKCYQRFGPDQLFFRITGVVDPMRLDKGNPDENYDIVIGYDVLNSDPETQETKLNQLVSLIQLDRNGRINPDALIDIAANAIDPIAADAILQPIEQAQQQIVQFVTDDLTKIFAGIEMPARPNGAQIALQVIQQYASQPDVAQRLQQDEIFAARLQKYAAQYTFQMQQAQNAQIGRIGTQPAAMGDVNTQSMGA